MKQSALPIKPAKSVREYVRERLRGLYLRQWLRAERRAGRRRVRRARAADYEEQAGLFE